MEFIVENWYVIVTGIVFIVGGVMAVEVRADSWMASAGCSWR